MILRHDKWYPIKTKVPPEDVEMHVWGPEIGLQSAWIIEGEWFRYSHLVFDLDAITHFHLFPEPPVD